MADDLYGSQHRALQDAFETRSLADRLELTRSSVLSADDQMFVSSVDMFFLSTVDHEGRPTVSYKGGDPGFVHTPDSSTLLFPSYDGNGMFLSLGNIASNAHVGLLFIAFDRPYRLRIQGDAELSQVPEDLARYPECDAVVRVHITHAFMNCPRYVHRMDHIGRSRYVPRDGIETPLAEWKRIDGIAETLPPAEALRVREAGLIDGLDWKNRVKAGDETV
jgi:uncharacterized protein